jgi:RimJ/RimL family protein N-acetyltransferase
VTLPLETARLVIRAFGDGDEREIERAFADPEVIWWDQPFTLQKAVAWVARAREESARSGMGLYALVLRADGRLIGDCGLVPRAIDGEELVEIGWHLERPAWGRGYATEAARAVLAHAEELGVRRVCSLIVPGNLRSRRVADKLGMTIAREVVHAGLPHDLWVLDLA